VPLSDSALELAAHIPWFCYATQFNENAVERLALELSSVEKLQDAAHKLIACIATRTAKGPSSGCSEQEESATSAKFYIRFMGMNLCWHVQKMRSRHDQLGRSQFSHAKQWSLRL
jgi:hypothetical protein